MTTLHGSGKRTSGSVRWRVGELAKRTGLSVRTLHYYDEIGLLSPSLHTRSGHRLYGEGDVVRLQQILSLRQLGLALDEIRRCLERRETSPLGVIERHLARVRDEIVEKRKLCRRLEALACRLRSHRVVSIQQFVETIEAITMFEKYFTREQMDALAIRKQQIGETRIRQVEAEWPGLIAQVRAAMDRGADPASREVQALAQRWMALVNEFTGGNQAIAKSLRTMYEENPDLGPRFGTSLDRAMLEFVGRAVAAGRR